MPQTVYSDSGKGAGARQNINCKAAKTPHVKCRKKNAARRITAGMAENKDLVYGIIR